MPRWPAPADGLWTFADGSWTFDWTDNGWEIEWDWPPRWSPPPFNWAAQKEWPNGYYRFG